MNPRAMQFASTMKRMIDNASKVPNYVPVSGNVGQDCLGYFQDKNGRLFRILPQPRDGSQLGPGSYNPEKPSYLSRSCTIGKTSKREPFKITNTFLVGPGDYDTSKKSTKLPHAMPVLKEENPLEEFYRRVPQNGRSISSSYRPKTRTSQPHRLYPQVKFDTRTNTRQFLSKEERLLFNMKFEPKQAPQQFYTKQPITEAESSAVFKSRSDRFIETTSTGPDPTTYTIRDPIGRRGGPTYNDLIPEAEPAVFHPTPGPADYADVPAPKPKPASAVFRSKVERRLLQPREGPSPADYQPDRDTESILAAVPPVSIFSRLENRPKEDVGPAPCDYGGADKPRSHVKGGRMAGVGRRALDRPPGDDGSGMEFATQHGDFIQPTFNVRKPE